MNRDNLVQRLLFAAWAVPLGWLAINIEVSLLPPGLLVAPDVHVYPGHLGAILVIFLACSEYIRMLSISFPRNGFWLAYIWLALQFISHFTGRLEGTQLDTYMLLLLVAGEAVIWGNKAGRWKRASLLFSGIAFLSVAGFSMVYLYQDPFQSIFPSRFDNPLLAQLGIVTVFASTFACDSAAYFAGKAFGRHRLSAISPRKTVEGAAAGFAAAIAVFSLGWCFLAPESNVTKYGIAVGIAAGSLIGVFAKVGDLIVSLIKRSFRVKDSSNMIPGHGGVLDRFDSVFFAIPVVHLLFLVVGKFIE